MTNFVSPGSGMVGRWIERLRRVYERDKNPLAAWAAYREARNFYVPVPEWALEYFDACAQNLRSVGPGAGGARKIENAMGMWTAGKGNVFRRFAVAMLHEHAVDCVLDVRGKPGAESLDLASEEVATLLRDHFGADYDSDTIRRWFNESCKMSRDKNG